MSYPVSFPTENNSRQLHTPFTYRLLQNLQKSADCLHLFHTNAQDAIGIFRYCLSVRYLRRSFAWNILIKCPSQSHIGKLSPTADCQNRFGSLYYTLENPKFKLIPPIHNLSTSTLYFLAVSFRINICSSGKKEPVTALYKRFYSFCAFHPGQKNRNSTCLFNGT